MTWNVNFLLISKCFQNGLPKELSVHCDKNDWSIRACLILMMALWQEYVCLMWFFTSSGNDKNWITWVCQKEVFVPTFVLKLFHHSLLLIRVLAQQLHNLRVLHKKNCQFFLHIPFFLRMIRITLINGFKFFSFGLDLPPSTDIGYFMNLILEWPEMQ